MRRFAFASFGLLSLAAFAWTQHARAEAKERSSTQSVLTQLLTAERELWDAWKNGTPETWQSSLTNDAVFFGEYGVAQKAELVDEQRQSITSCKVQSYSLTSPRVILIEENSAILLYEAEQHAICGGAEVQPFMHGSSVYVHRNGKWLNIFRSEIPAKK
jgi:hypothetical protein